MGFSDRHGHPQWHKYCVLQKDTSDSEHAGFIPGEQVTQGQFSGSRPQPQGATCPLLMEIRVQEGQGCVPLTLEGHLHTAAMSC